MRVWASPYTLRFRTPIGVAPSRERTGALVKIETPAGYGYADLHPWTELGDESLATQLSRLRDGHPTGLAARSVALATLDAAARERGVSVFAEGPPPPPSHRLVAIEELSPEFLNVTGAAGFRTLKIKIGADPDRDVEILARLARELASFRLRLDANARLSPATFLRFAARVPQLAVEFCEDPVPTADVGAWRSLSTRSPWPLAIDRVESTTLESLRAPWIVLKPAAQDPRTIADWARTHRARIAVTSYLDHPVGQVGAALEAARLLRDGFEIGTCGLASHLVYEANEFSEALGFRGPEFTAPAGTGIGFDGLFARLDWKAL